MSEIYLLTAANTDYINTLTNTDNAACLVRPTRGRNAHLGI